MSGADSAGAHCVGAGRQRKLSVNAPDAGVREEVKLGVALIPIKHPSFVFRTDLQSQGVKISKSSPFSTCILVVDVLLGYPVAGEHTRKRDCFYLYRVCYIEPFVMVVVFRAHLPVY